MDVLLSQQIEQLKQKQLVLESQLRDSGAPAVNSCADLADYRQVQEIIPNANIKEDKLDPISSTQTHAAEFSDTENMSLHDRLQELQHLKNKHQRCARRALQKYFTAVSDYSGYQKRREQHLKVKPFSFTSRDLMKSPRIYDSRMLEERRQREEELDKILHTPFRANPVPPTTFMNKYDLMVEEWRERKVAVERLAREQAERAREESAFIRLSAMGLRNARGGVLGPYCELDSEQPRRRVQSADGGGGRQQGLSITQPEDVALEVRMRFWPAIKEHEQVRKERIKERAVGLKKEVDEHRRKVMPLLTSPTPIKLFTEPQEGWFGVGRPLGVGSGPAPSSPPPPPQAGPGQEGAAAAVVAAEKTYHLERGTTPCNPNLTFHPMIRPGVPQFHKIWARYLAEEATMRKKKPPPTVPKPFGLTPSAKDVTVCGKRPTRSASQPVAKRASSARERPIRHAKSHGDEGKQEKNEDNATSGAQSKVIPKGTRAHALRTEMVYCKYIKKIKEQDLVPEAEQAFLKEIAKRRREISKRLARYLGDPHAEKEATIRSKLKELRAVMRENEKAAKMRLKEMKERVAQLPPIFAEPTRLNSLAKARVEAEREILKMLNQSGLDAATIRDIITRPVDGGSAGTENADELAVGTAMAETGGEGEPIPADRADMTEGGVVEPAPAGRDIDMRGSSKTSRSSSCSSLSSLTKKSSHESNSSLSSSSPGTADGPKVGEVAPPKVVQRTSYSDDSFEGSSSSSSV